MDATVSHLIISHSYGDLYPVAGFRVRVIPNVSPTVLKRHQAQRGELERRLLEFGFVEGARIEVLHEGAIGRDPVAVKLDDMRVGLRRREAHGVIIRLDGAAS
jgi:ferrous iron transport protein A